MAHALHKACADGDRQTLHAILADPVDLDAKNHDGATPLIEAVKNAHVDIVALLLEKGADPTAAEQYTSDAHIIDLLRVAAEKRATGTTEPKIEQVPFVEAYPYYPTINPPLSTINEGGYYYAPPPQSGGESPGGGLGNLPPPEVSRLIPCRYFPACRYGAQCMFAHPPAPFFQGPMPPVQYPPFDPMANSYMQPYYAPPPPPSSFQPPPPVHAISPMSPPPMMHTRSASEVVSPGPSPFPPNGPPPAHFGPMSPPVYHPHGPVHLPIPGPPMPQPHGQPQHIPHSPVHLYNGGPPPPQPFPVPQDTVNGYQGPVAPKPAYTDANGVKLPEQPAEPFNGARDANRRPGRRPSFTSRKPPCLFFPAGRCKNGDDCRFPHVLPEAGAPAPTNFPTGRTNPPRPRTNGPNGLQGIDSKLANLTFRDDQPRQKNGAETPNRPQTNDMNGRPKFSHAGKQHPNGTANFNRKPGPPKQQRVPNADEFPVLGGSTTPPRVATNGANGPTAAQVLQAPPPFRRAESKESTTRGTTPDSARSPVKEAPIELSPSVSENEAPAPKDAQPTANGVGKHAVLSFAAAAANGGSSTDVSKEVSVSA